MFKEIIKKNSAKEKNYKKEEIDYGTNIIRNTSLRTERYRNNGTYYELINPTRDDEAIIMCTGDLMCEPAMSESCYFEPQYCFNSLFKYVREVFLQSDFLIGNLETMVTEYAPYAREKHRINGRYHCNAPVEFLDALRYAGFDAFALANNHNADVGYKGLVDTLNNIDRKKFMRTGLFLNENESRVLLVNINNIKVAILSYTEHINQNLDNKVFTEEGRNTLINRYSLEKIKRDINFAKQNDAEFILCYIHFLGMEYSHEVINRQRTLAKEVADAGVDCIMGSHTHSLQKYDRIKSSDGRSVPVVYSLGNFITSDNTSMITRSNIIYKLTLRRNIDGKVELVKDNYIPCRVIEGILKSMFSVFPTQAIYRQYRKSQLLEDAQANIEKIIGDKIEIDPVEIEGIEGKVKKKYTEVKKITLRKISYILGIVIPEKFRGIIDTPFNYCTARYSWVRDNSVYFSRFVGEIEESDARLAFNRGAKIIFSSKQLRKEDGSNLPCIIVTNPAWCFYRVIRWLRSLYNANTIAITGSVGKTTTKEMVYHVLNKQSKTLKNGGNANSHEGIADTIQRLEDDHNTYVQEVGGFSPGMVEAGGFMLHPDACIITNIGYPHIDLYGSIENIMKDKLSLADNLSDNGVVFLNYDDARLSKVELDKTIISFGINNKDADYVANEIEYGEGIIKFKVECKDGEYPVKIHMYGKHNILNALAAFAVGRWNNIPVDDIIKSLNDYRSEGMRQNVVDIGGVKLYMDCYNSAPNSLQTSVHALAIMNSSNRKIAVIGDIPRLGDLSEKVHQSVAKKLINENIDEYLLYGKYCKAMYNVFKDAGILAKHTESREELNTWIKKDVKRGDIVLFKAGHPMALAKTVDQVFGTSFHILDGDVLLDNSKDCSTEEYRARWIDGVVEIRKAKPPIIKASNIIIPEQIHDTFVGRIGKEAFQSLNFKKIQFPSNLYNIGGGAFENCSNLAEITFKEGLKVIEEKAFKNCDLIRSLALPKTLNDIGEQAFYECSGLEEIYIPDSVGHIGTDAFFGCDKIMIICHKNSYAEAYAKKNKIKFSVVEE